MAETQDPNAPASANVTIESGSNFLGKKPEPATSDDILYNDFFQESSNGEVMIGSKITRSSLEVLVSIVQYITIFIVVLWIFWWIHVFIRTSESTSFLENYSFLCPYLNYDIKNPASERWCKNITAINKEYTEKKTILENNIITSLTEFIPIKVSSSILDASPERKFVIETYDNKPDITKVIKAFEDVKSESQSILGENITCNGLVIRNWFYLSTQCIIYGWEIGDTDSNGQIWSARIEALQFIDKIANTSKSSLVFENRPITLSIETLSTKEAQAKWFSTRTTIPVQVQYIPLTKKL